MTGNKIEFGLTYFFTMLLEMVKKVYGQAVCKMFSSWMFQMFSDSSSKRPKAQAVLPQGQLWANLVEVGVLQAGAASG